MSLTTDSEEQHPLFPSGEWEGFYTYNTNGGGQKHGMHCILTFSQGKLNGEGGDDVGPFRWRGQYDKEQMYCRMIKFYPFHDVFYEGHVDENGIWGTWRLSGMAGGFHIWPKGYDQRAEATEDEVLIAPFSVGPPEQEDNGPTE